MISDSYFWKEALLSGADWLRRVRYSERKPDELMFRLEREVFFGFYSIRKLCDTFKISDDTKEMLVEVGTYPQVKSVDYMNAHRVDELYNFALRSERQLPLLFVCNQFIHSYVFSALWKENNQIDSLLVSSDRTRQRELHSVPLSQITKVFRKVGKDYPNEGFIVRDPKTLQFSGRMTTRK